MSANQSSPSAPAGDKPFVISRTFDAPHERVFAALTQPEHLLHWMGPKGFQMIKCSVDLRPGGLFHYGLRAPDGMTMWGKWIYREITPPERLVVEVYFSDESAGVTRHPMAADRPQATLSTTTLDEQNGKTVLTLQWRALNATPVEQKLFDASHAGMTQGWGGTMDQLAAYLGTVSKAA